jgi:hypothetical protein
MKQTWLVGAVASVMFVASAVAQTQPPASTQKPPQTQTTTQKPTAKPETKTDPQPSTAKPPATQEPTRTTRTTTQRTPAEVPTGEVALGTVTIPRSVTADGKALGRGRYTVRLTAQAAQPTVAGQLPDLNRWVEFVQGGQVRGREVVSIVPADEVDDTQQGPDMSTGSVPRNATRVEMLKGGEYLRVWIARGGHHYLVHLVPA